MTDDELRACLPASLRGAPIAKIAAGLSGASVYRVGDAHVLKITTTEPGWADRVEQQRRAAEAGVAPRVVHVDEARGAVASELVIDRGLAPRLGTPATRAETIDLIGRAIRRVHAIELAPGAAARDPLDLLRMVWSARRVAMPAFVGETVERLLAEVPPPSDRETVFSHNDANPTNLVFDGERIVLLDWDTAGPNDPYNDLAAVAVFFRLDDAACLRLLSAYDGAPVSALPPRFSYARSLVAGMCGAIFLHLAAARGAPGSAQAFDETPSFADLLPQMRTGAISPATAEGQWAMGLGLVKSSALY